MSVAVICFLVTVALTLVITAWAARKGSDRHAMYAASGRITGTQNGLAIAGDFMSATTVLGVVGLYFAGGVDTMIYFIAPLVSLCLILLSYETPLTEVDAQMKAHVDWLEVGFDEGVFLIAGRRNPRTGGVILARGHADKVTEVAKSDPFVTSGVASFEVVPFNASFAAPAIADLLA